MIKPCLKIPSNIYNIFILINMNNIWFLFQLAFFATNICSKNAHISMCGLDTFFTLLGLISKQRLQSHVSHLSVATKHVSFLYCLFQLFFTVILVATIVRPFFMPTDLKEKKSENSNHRLLRGYFYSLFYPIPSHGK